jgi:nucleoside-diphosphate-sugar epimerase
MEKRVIKRIAVAGAMGDLGLRIVRNIIARGGNVRALVRLNSDQQVIQTLMREGAEIVQVDYKSPASLSSALSEVYCVVSALSGLRDVIVDTQSLLLQAAIKTNVVKFIPSDYCIDYNGLTRGGNRNLDFRREFSQILATSPIKVTSILNGMFTDLLTGVAPVVLFKQKRIFFWGNADQKMDFTTIENTAQFTAAAALDSDSPRWLKVAGEVASMRDLKNIASEVEGKPFKFLRPGGLSAFRWMIKMTKLFSPGKNEIFPAWQGMQYLHDMLSGKPKLERLDNDRYSHIKWVKIAEVLRSR